MPEQDPVFLNVANDETGLKLTWSDVRQYRPYHVDYSDLKDDARLVRVALQKVVDEALAGRPTAPALKNLAFAGAQLHNRIFQGIEAQLSAAAKSWLVERHSRAQLTIRTQERIHIPWGLAFAGDPSKLPDVTDERSPDFYAYYTDFWSIRHSACTVYDPMVLDFRPPPQPGSEPQRLNVINSSAWEQAERSYEPSAAEAAARAFLFSERTTSSRSFEEMWQKRQNDIDLLYVYCHADPQNLLLSKENNDVIRIRDFTRRFQHDPARPLRECMVFLNGCSTAIGDDERGGFLRATGQFGFCGFIGPNAKVPDVFAQRFGTAFYACLLDTGWEVRNVMHELRKQHWPCSIVYDTCCDPSFRIGNDPHLSGESNRKLIWNAQNLSFDPPLGTTTI